VNRYLFPCNSKLQLRMKPQRKCLTAIHTFSKPICPPLRSLENYITSIKLWQTLHFPVRNIASAFHQFHNHGMTDPMLQVLDAMGALTLAVNHYVQDTATSVSIGQISRTRMAIQHLLLLLPGLKELELTTVSTPNIYECCRLTAMIFGVALFGTIPNTHNVL
jgi:hypothetical protein